MSGVALQSLSARERLGLKGPGAPQWLTAQGIELPPAPNTWVHARNMAAAERLLVARLGSAEFFLEDAAAGAVGKLRHQLAAHPPGVYPVLREDCGFLIGGGGVHDVLAAVCNVDFADLALADRPLIMTMMVGVAVLIVPEQADDRGLQYRIWCDPSFGHYLGESLRNVVVDCGGRVGGVEF